MSATTAPATNAGVPTRTSGRLRAVLALGSVLLLSVGITAAGFNHEAHVLITGSEDSATGIGYAEAPAIWLSDGSPENYVVPPPADRDYRLKVFRDAPITTDPETSFAADVWIFPRWGATYALDVTPTLTTALPADDASGPDPFPWLRFTVKFPDGRTLENLSAKDFNEHSERSFTACNKADGSIGYSPCAPAPMELTVSLDPLTPYTFRNSKANFRVTFEGITNPERPDGTP